MTIVLCSGGFAPLHVGHLEHIAAASMLGRVIVAVNSDAWLRRKVGRVFMPEAERVIIMSALWCVEDAFVAKDDDDTICLTLLECRPDIYCNGGDRISPNEAEHKMCVKLGIMEAFNVGGGKIRSSTEIIEAASK